MHIYGHRVYQIRLTWQYTIYLLNKYITVQHCLRKGIKLFVHNTTVRLGFFLSGGNSFSACIRTTIYIYIYICLYITHAQITVLTESKQVV